MIWNFFLIILEKILEEKLFFFYIFSQLSGHKNLWAVLKIFSYSLCDCRTFLSQCGLDATAFLAPPQPSSSWVLTQDQRKIQVQLDSSPFFKTWEGSTHNSKILNKLASFNWMNWNTFYEEFGSFAGRTHYFPV